jgi:hypothetical protein
MHKAVIRTAVFAAGFLFTGFSTRQSIQKMDYIAFQPGERLEYDLDFNGINGGEATFDLKNDKQVIAGQPHFHLYVTGRSNKLVDPFYKVRDIYESFFDEKTLLPSAFFRDVKEGSYKKTEYYLFNQPKGLVKIGDQTHSVEANQTFDLLSAFYYLRCIDFSKAKPGYKVQLNSFFDGGIFPMGVEFKGRKTVKTGIGNVKCLVFTPMLITGRIFKDQSGMKLYVSDDKNQIPVLIESEVYLGTVRASLRKYSGLKFPFSALGK